MRENEERTGHLAPLLRRIIILVAVLIAAPAIMWTITAFVRAYVAPPKIPTFSQITAMADGTDRSKSDAGGLLQWAEAKLAAPSAAVLDASGKAKSDVGGLLQWATDKARIAMPSGATATANSAAPAADAATKAPPPQEPPAAEGASDRAAGQASAQTVADASASSAGAKADISTVSSLPPKSDGAPQAGTSAPPASTGASMTTPQTFAALSSAQPLTVGSPPILQSATQALAMQGTTMQPGTAQRVAEQPVAGVDAAPAAQPLTGPIPLPRHRPSDVTMVRITAANVPMPRPRPGTAQSAEPVDAAATTTTGSSGPVDFLQNLLH